MARMRITRPGKQVTLSTHWWGACRWHPCGDGNDADTGSGEWQLALGLLSGMDVDSGEWQLAVVLLSGMNVGGDEW